MDLLIWIAGSLATGYVLIETIALLTRAQRAAAFAAAPESPRFRATDGEAITIDFDRSCRPDFPSRRALPDQFDAQSCHPFRYSGHSWVIPR